MPEQTQKSSPVSADAKQRPTRLLSEPDDKTSFGYTVWLTIGGPNGKIKNAAVLLKLTPSNMSSFLRGRHNVSAAAVAKKGWIRILEEKYPDGWREYGKLLLERQPKSKGSGKAAAQQTAKPAPVAKPSAQSLQEEAWKRDAGVWLSGLLEQRGDDISDIMPCMKDNVVLNNIHNWQKAMQGDLALPLSVYVSMIKRMNKIYELKATRSAGQYDVSQKLLTRLVL